MKLAPSGEPVWLAPWTNDVLKAIALDNSGNVIVTGLGGTAKYDSDGHQLWLADTTAGEALALDDAGNAHVAGSVSGQEGVAKLTPSGATLWMAPWTNGSPTALAMDPAGNLCVTGSDGDYVTAKYDRAGSQLWIARYQGRCGFPDTAKAIAVDWAGNVIVSGESSEDASCRRRGCQRSAFIVTIKYDASGRQLWASREGPDQRRRVALAVDGTGDVYLASGSLVKYDLAGNRLWQQSSGEAMAVSVSGHDIFVAAQHDADTVMAKLVQREVPGAPRITVSPQRQVIFTEAVVTLSVTATGDEPLSYQWLQNLAPVPNATNANLVLNEPPMAADFAVQVRNAAGMTLSPEARVMNLSPVTLQLVYRPDGGSRVGVSPAQAWYFFEVSTDLMNWRIVNWAPSPSQYPIPLEDGPAFYRARALPQGCCGNFCGE